MKVSVSPSLLLYHGKLEQISHKCFLALDLFTDPPPETLLGILFCFWKCVRCLHSNCGHKRANLPVLISLFRCVLPLQLFLSYAHNISLLPIPGNGVVIQKLKPILHSILKEAFQLLPQLFLTPTQQVGHDPLPQHVQISRGLALSLDVPGYFPIWSTILSAIRWMENPESDMTRTCLMEKNQQKICESSESTEIIVPVRPHLLCREEA